MTRALVALLVVLLAGAPAFAQAQAQATDPEAKLHYDQAMAAYGLGRYAEAATEFEKAYERKPQPALLFNAAQSHRQAGNRQRARELYENYVHIYGRQASNGADVRRLIEQLDAEEAAAAKQQPVAPTPAPAPAAVSESALVATAPPRRKPLYERAWFWGAVAGGAIVVGGVIALGVVYGSSTKNPTPTIGTWTY